MSNLDKSWNNKVSDWVGSDANLYLLGASDFQERAIIELKKENSKYKKNPIGVRSIGIEIALRIIKDLRSY